MNEYHHSTTITINQFTVYFHLKKRSFRIQCIFYTLCTQNFIYHESLVHAKMRKLYLEDCSQCSNTERREFNENSSANDLPGKVLIKLFFTKNQKH